MGYIPTIGSACLIFVCVGCFVTSASALENIRSKADFLYNYGDSVRATSNDTFVICPDCKIDRLEKAQPVHHVAIRYIPPAVAGSGQNNQDQTPHGLFNRKAEGPEREGGPGGTLGTILFKFDNSMLSPAETAKLDGIASSYVSQGGVLQVNGYTCDIGAPEYNDRLSMRRAKNVADYLRGKGLRNLQVAAKGECCPVADKKKLNRRVEILEKGNY